MNSLYAEGTSFLHRARASIKLLGLFVTLAVVFAVPNVFVVAAVGILALVLFQTSRLGLRRAGRAVRPVLPIVVLVLIVQTIFYSLERGALLSTRLVVAVLVASLLTHTTRTTDLLDLVYRGLAPFRRLGVDPWQVSLALALTITSVPVVSSSLRTSREAYLARGLRGGGLRAVVPVAVRLIRSSESIGDAISARGLDADPWNEKTAPVVRGSVVDDQTRCVHYHSDLDVVAIKFACCGEYYPCHLCHAESAGHPAALWPLTERSTEAILCGVCQGEISIAEYLETEHCPLCSASFNPGCALHAHLYFETENSPSGSGALPNR